MPSTKRIAMSFVAIAALAGGAVGGHWWWTEGRFVESTDNAYVQGDISAIAPQIDGYVADVLVGDNQAVKAGDVLVRIDDRDFKARVDQANAALQTAKANHETIRSQIVYQQTLVAQAQAQLEAANAEARRAQQQYDRYAKLVNDKVISHQEFDDAEATLVKGKADVIRSAAAINAQQAQLVVIQAQLKEAEAKVNQSAAEAELAANDLDKTVIRAPIDGVVGNRGVRVGHYIKSGTQLLSLVPTDVYVVANFKETQLTHMKPGQKVEVDVDAYPDTPLTGEVESFAPASGALFSLLPPENATGNFTKIVQRLPVRIKVANGNPLHGMLRPGLSVEAKVDTKTAGDNGKTLVSETGGPGGSLFGSAQASPVEASVDTAAAPAGSATPKSTGN
ncbi:MAG TPA: HlyD family secretion protein [Dongiaceae bacterium]|nr:HlyD family secretion protein [Dongiaceae bacterium]